METKEIKIRRATIDDLSSICALSQLLFEHERQFTDEYNMNWSQGEAGQKSFTKCLKSRKSFILLAQDGNVPVGYVRVTTERLAWRAFNPIAEVENLIILPAYRGKGIGTKLMQQAKKMAIKRGAKRMSVNALTKNTNTLKFYQQHGFENLITTMVMKVD